ncbi:MAG: AAA family ATPase [Solibacillus sp.]
MSTTRLQQIQQSLNNKFYDREAEIEALMTALLSRQHILFIGPAGTGKSALSAMLGEIIDGSQYFQHLLTPFSTPEELFGVLSLKDLERGVYKRNIRDMLPEAHFAFIDEIFKANSAILNSLLTLINERIFYNNGIPVKSPLMTIVGSSNEYIEEGEGLEALFDRFLLRYEVNYIREQDQFIAMLKAEEQASVPKMTLHELELYQKQVDQVQMPDGIYSTLAKVRRKLHDASIRPSDRRFKQALSILKAKAYLDNRHAVERRDLDILGNVLWETIDQRASTIEILNDTVFDSVETFLNRVRPEFESILLNAQHAMIGKSPHNRAKLSELLMQGKALFLEVQAMNRQTPNRPELVTLKNDMHKRLLQMTSDVIGF